MLAGRIGDTLKDPTAGLAPIRTAAGERINRRYQTLPNSVSAKLAQRGYGSSGLLQKTMGDIEISRAGEMSDIEGLLAQLAVGREQDAMSLGNQLLASTRGSSSSGSGTGTVTQPGNFLGGLATGGMQTIFAMMGLNAAMGNKPFDFGNWGGE